MTDSTNTRELILGILTEVNEEGRYSHLVIRSVLEKYQYLTKQERAFITRVSEGTIQRRIELDYIIDCFSKVKGNKMKPLIRNLLRMSVYQIKYMDAVPNSAVCNEAVKLARKKGFSGLSGFVNGVLRGISRGLSEITYPDPEQFPVEALSVRYSMPEWIVEQWIRDYGEARTEQMLSASLEQAPITVRTNLARITPQELKERLAGEGVTVEELDSEAFPELFYAFAISGIDHLNGLESFRQGLFYIQDISSMMAAEYAAPKEGDCCIDVCAAPGGKSILLAEKMKETGCVEARDLTEYKVSLIEENISRCGLSNIRAVQQDATVFDEGSVGKADVLMADLPCSGLGTLRKKTDVKYRMSEAGQEELIALQRSILDTVYSYVKPGGTLLYSTCTVHRGENEENVRWFVKEHPEFKVEYQRQIFPGEHMGDGFFIAKLIRQR
ncbi:MAG: 16S rRNA (cytosine(967)-C(5))-methyltransferase RsmB [Roseburia sp.]|nr:16S rRNA (cytosine(967)-C(5))-methyltransferase RsmB [Roseburia sp.]